MERFGTFPAFPLDEENGEINADESLDGFPRKIFEDDDDDENEEVRRSEQWEAPLEEGNKAVGLLWLEKQKMVSSDETSLDMWNKETYLKIVMTRINKKRGTEFLIESTLDF